MKLEEIAGKIASDPLSVFEYLRMEDVGVRITAVDAYIDLLSRDESLVRGSISDFVEILGAELLPGLAVRQDAEGIGALSHIVSRLGDMALALSKPTALLGLIDKPLFEIASHPSARVVSVTIGALGKIFRAMPEEFSIERATRFLSFLSSEDPAIVAASALAWGGIARVGSDRGAMAVSRIFALLEDPSSEVRNQAVGYFFSLAQTMPARCAFALPVLRKVRDSDSDNAVRERAAAAVLAITKI